VGLCAGRFINGRRRILQPMLDSAGAAAVEPKPKSNKGSTKSAQRFWPENIAGLQVQPSALTVEDSDSHVSNDVREDLLWFFCNDNIIRSTCTVEVNLNRRRYDMMMHNVLSKTA